MKTFLRLLRLFVMRNMREERFLTSLSVIGIALGIALFIAVKVASDRAMASFEADVRGTTLRANYEILDLSGIDFDEKIYPAIQKREEASFPVLTAHGYLPVTKETVTIEGIDTVRAAGFFHPRSKNQLDREDFFKKMNGILITGNFSESHSLKKGDILKLLAYNSEYLLEIIGILEEKSLPANTVIMDLGNFQEYFGKTGCLSRIDLVTDEQKAEVIRKVLPPDLLVEKKEELIKNRESLLKSFRYNLQFVSLIAILVGIFLLYNTVFISVVKRRSEIGILRGLGADKGTIVLLFIVQGLIMGAAGSLLGIILGQAASYFSVLAVEETISTMYAPVSISDYFISGREVALAIIMGVCVSLIASAVPAYESSRIRPNESMQEGSFEGRYRGHLKLFFVAGVLCTAAGGAASAIDYRLMPFEFPFLAYGGIVLIIAGFTFISPSYLTGVLKVAGALPERAFGVGGKIAVGDMAGNIYRFSVAVMSVAISCAMILAFLALIFSFRHSLTQWIHRNISADIYIKAASCTSNYCFFPLPDEVVKTVENMAGVVNVDKFRALLLDFRGRKVVAGFGLRDKTWTKDSMIEVSRYLAIRYGLKKGDSLEIRTPKGKETFIIGDVFSSYSTTSGFIYMDRRQLRNFWGLEDATQVGITVRKGTDVHRFIRDLKDRYSGRYALEIMNNEELRRKVLTIFDRTFAITYAIELIAILVSLIGVVNTLLALVLERKREISILRYLGGSWKQIREVLLIAAGIVGASGIIWGAALGALMSVIFVEVVNTISFGWEIRFRIPALTFSLVMAALFIATLAAGLIPSKVAKQIDPKRFISFE